MPAVWIKRSDADEIHVAGARTLVYDLINDSRFQDTDKTKTALVLKDVLQADLDTTTRLRDLPDDEPTKTTDPAPEFGEQFFWRDHGINQVVVARDTIVEDCFWDGTVFVFALRYAVGPS